MNADKMSECFDEEMHILLLFRCSKGKGEGKTRNKKCSARPGTGEETRALSPFIPLPLNACQAGYSADSGGEPYK